MPRRPLLRITHTHEDREFWRLPRSRAPTLRRRAFGRSATSECHSSAPLEFCSFVPFSQRRRRPKETVRRVCDQGRIQGWRNAPSPNELHLWTSFKRDARETTLSTTDFSRSSSCDRPDPPSRHSAWSLATGLLQRLTHTASARRNRRNIHSDSDSDSVHLDVQLR